MKKDPTIREAIDESLCSVRFNAQDERAVLAAMTSLIISFAAAPKPKSAPAA